MIKPLRLFIAAFAVFLALPYGVSAEQDGQIVRKGPANEYIATALAMPEGGFLLTGYKANPSIESEACARTPLARRIDREGRVLWDADVETAAEWDVFTETGLLADGRIRLCRRMLDGAVLSNRIVTLLPDGTVDEETELPPWVTGVAFAGETIYGIGRREPTNAEKDAGTVLSILMAGSVDASGNMLWVREIEASEDDLEGLPWITGMAPAGDDLLLYGSSFVPGVGEKGLLLKIDSEGNTVWHYQSKESERVTDSCLLPDGSVFGVGGSVFHLGPDGSPRFEESLPLDSTTLTHDILSWEDGYLLLSKIQGLSQLTWIDAQGAARTRIIPLSQRLTARMCSGKLLHPLQRDHGALCRWKHCLPRLACERIRTVAKKLTPPAFRRGIGSLFLYDQGVALPSFQLI